MSSRDRLQLAAIVVAGSVANFLLALPMRNPRIFGDELIYWILGRNLAWTGHLTARGTAQEYGVVYPAVLAVSHRLGGSEPTAFVLAQAIDCVLFSLAAVPAYAIAARVMSGRAALLAALLAVVLPSSVYASAVMTENVFYPAFLTAVFLMLRALERPTVARQLVVAGACVITFLVRSQAVVLLPAYLVAALIVTRRVRVHIPTLVVLAAGAAAAALRGNSGLGPYHVLVTTYSIRLVVHWAAANAADLALYVGVIPLGAFALLVAGRAAPELRRLVVLTLCVGAGLLLTVAALSASVYGLGRMHERNIFCLVPLILICFLAWLEDGARRPRTRTIFVAVVLVLLPFTIPASAIDHSGEDGLALVWWDDIGVRSTAVMALAVAVAAVVFVFARRRVVLLAVPLAVLAVTLAGAERRTAADAAGYAGVWADRDWIDRAVGPDADVVALWLRPTTGGRFYPEVQRVWADEFFNRSVRDVASAGGPLPDGLPVRTLVVRGTCVRGDVRPEYVVADASQRLALPVVAKSPSGRAVLYRVREGKCLARLEDGAAPESN